ncbi:MAG: MG284/MPN403 family protein [Bacilli bacterium]
MKNNHLSFIKEFEFAIVNIQHAICTLCIKFDTDLKIEYFQNPMQFDSSIILSCFQKKASKFADSINESEEEKNKKIIEIENARLVLRKATGALSMITPEYRNIIIREYIFNNDKIWWVNFYSRSTFYRKRTKAIDSFWNYYLL